MGLKKLARKAVSASKTPEGKLALALAAILAPKLVTKVAEKVAQGKVIGAVIKGAR